MSEENSADKPVPSNFYELRYDFGLGRSLTINGSLYLGQTDEEKYQELRRTVDIVERQRANLEIELLEHNIKQQKKQLEDMVDDLAQKHEQLSASKGRDKEPNLKAHLAGATKAKDQIVTSIREGEAEIERRRQFVATGVRA